MAGSVGSGAVSHPKLSEPRRNKRTVRFGGIQQVVQAFERQQTPASTPVFAPDGDMPGGWRAGLDFEVTGFWGSGGHCVRRCVE
jgi:hypothetical protein